MTDKELCKLSVRELIFSGVCPTCLDRRTNGGVYGDDSKLKVYEDKDIMILYVGNPRAIGHMIISTIEHYQDFTEAPDYINEKIIRYSKVLALFIKEIHNCERVYICSMCDGPSNHYHMQLIPRYKGEEIGKENFCKPRQKYIFNEEKFHLMKEKLKTYSKNDV